MTLLASAASFLLSAKRKETELGNMMDSEKVSQEELKLL